MPGSAVVDAKTRGLGCLVDNDWPGCQRLHPPHAIVISAFDQNWVPYSVVRLKLCQRPTADCPTVSCLGLSIRTARMYPQHLSQASTLPILSAVSRCEVNQIPANCIVGDGIRGRRCGQVHQTRRPDSALAIRPLGSARTANVARHLSSERLCPERCLHQPRPLLEPKIFEFRLRAANIVPPTSTSSLPRPTRIR